MKESIRQKLESLVERHQEISVLLSDSETITDQKRFREFSIEYSHLEPVISCFQRYQEAEKRQQEAKILLTDPEPDLRRMAEEEIGETKRALTDLEAELQILLLPKDPNDTRNVYLEIRAGAGGDEASLFSGDLFRMYARYAENQGWRVEVVSENAGVHGGYKEIISKICGQNVFSHLKFESGAHRVQRVPTTEAQGRIHTSTCTVAILPEVDEIDDVTISPDELKIDTYRSSGAGGQHVNVTDSAVRITHLPTGIVVECQDERSQHKNRAKAMSLLRSKILAEEQARQQREVAEKRRSLVGTGDRSERIRTYNFPQGRVTDHRINLTLYQIDQIMNGDLQPLISALSQEHQAQLLTEASI